MRRTEFEPEPSPYRSARLTLKLMALPENRKYLQPHDQVRKKGKRVSIAKTLSQPRRSDQEALYNPLVRVVY